MAKNKSIKVGTASAKRGERTTGHLTLGHYPDAPISSPVIIAAGSEDGPTLWVQGCVHGPEVGGPVGILRFFASLDLNQVKGTVVAVMLANPLAFRALARNTPYDGENLNRVFPGGAADGHTRQIAGTLLRTALKTADAMLDLHSGGDRSIVPFYALYWNDGSPTSAEAARLARAAGTPDIWASTDGWLKGAMFTNLTRRGVPALIVECGGGAQVPDSHIDNYASAIAGVATAMGILAGEPPRQANYRVADNALLVYNTRGGMFVPAVEAGAVVKEGDELGRIMDLFGNIVETVRSPVGPGWIASIRRRYMPLHSGEQVAEVIGILEDR
ncbi:MAG: succinylglutamate desuccinylase/aspartoacylase family protein [Pseudomonadota bacterium]